MRKALFLLAFGLFMSDVASAEKIDKDEAYRVASEFFGGGAGRRMAPAAGGDATLRLAAEGEGYYAFNRGERGGYVIVAADDRAAESVLGFADGGTFSADSMPEPMRWWLGEYARQMDYAASRQAQPGRVSAPRAQRADIAPLLTSLWGQDDPYDLLCPTYEGEQCPSGCLATAISQIMYYHKWPERGTGSHSYRWTVDNRPVGTLSVDFSQSVYDWEAMADTYGEGSPQESREAVARLMYDVGVASDMQYHPLGSGAVASTAVSAMAKYFDYSRSVNIQYREFYTIGEWEDLVYNSLAGGLPVLYGGTTSGNEGHAFVCDGYSGGYFHINWGWDGMSNGYFLLSALDPSMQGTGGSDAGFNYYQDVAAVRPAQEGDVAVPMFCSYDGFGVRETSVGRNGTIVFTGGFWNLSGEAHEVTFGVRVVDAGGNASYVASADGGEFEPNYGNSFYRVEASEFPEETGLYKVYPAYRDEATGQWYDVMVAKDAGVGFVQADVTDRGIEFGRPERQEAALAAESVELLSTPYAKLPFRVKVKLSNDDAEYFDEVSVAMLHVGENQTLAMSDPVVVALEAGDSTEVEFTITAPSQTGDFELVAVDADYKIISERVEVMVDTTPVGEVSLAMPTAPVAEGGTTVSADNVRFTAEVECKSGFYGDLLYAYAFSEDAPQSYVGPLTAPLYVGPGESGTVSFSGQLIGTKEGGKYVIYLYYLEDSSTLRLIDSDNNRLHITIGSLTSVDGVGAAAAEGDIEVYTSAGVLVHRQKGSQADLSGLAPGLYIVKEGGTARKVVKR